VTDLARPLPVDLQDHVQTLRQLLFDGLLGGAVEIVEDLGVFEEGVILNR
jgi:hypothetical protein